jgi:hypothetical protein
MTVGGPEGEMRAVRLEFARLPAAQPPRPLPFGSSGGVS